MTIDVIKDDGYWSSTSSMSIENSGNPTEYYNMESIISGIEDLVDDFTEPSYDNKPLENQKSKMADNEIPSLTRLCQSNWSEKVSNFYLSNIQTLAFN